MLPAGRQFSSEASSDVLLTLFWFVCLKTSCKKKKKNLYHFFQGIINLVSVYSLNIVQKLDDNVLKLGIFNIENQFQHRNMKLSFVNKAVF